MLLPPFFWQDARHSFKEVLPDHYISWCDWARNFRDPRNAAILMFLVAGACITLKNWIILVMIAMAVLVEIMNILERTGMKIYWRQCSRARLKRSKKRAQAA